MTVFRAAALGIYFFAIFAGAKELIGKSKAAYSIGEILIKPAALAVVKAACGEEASKKLTTVLLFYDAL